MGMPIEETGNGGVETCCVSGEEIGMNSVELFAGAGGLALGVSQAGFRNKAVVEWDADACATIRHNQRRKVPLVRNWKLHQADVKSFDFGTIDPDIDLLAAGVPCQPWSMGGKHRGFEDERNLFPDTIRAVLALRPKAILIENVKGLTRQSFANYFTYIQYMLEFPEVLRKPEEEWIDHRTRLERFVASRGKGSRYTGLHYNIVVKLLNAADYGVPQRRERVFFVGFRDDIRADWAFPIPTHSQEALVHDKWGSGNYWDRHQVAAKCRPSRPDGIERKLESPALYQLRPWVTVRDAISGLPDPESREARSVSNHQLQLGARSYAGHTGSPLDESAKTVKAGDHGVPGGENMISFPDGRVRYFTVREAARIQTFPDEYEFGSSWSENMRQLGNAVPVSLGRIVAEAIRRGLRG